jgi:probable F420-dependent oxidoreductase
MTQPVELGYLIPTREAVMSGDVAAAPLIALAERAERSGYDSVWAGDSIVARARHDPLTLLPAVAARTSRVALGTAVLLPVLRHPVVMAHQVATLDRIAEGRLVLGVGIATDNPTTRHEFAAVGVEFDRRVGRFNDHLDLCRRLWSGETVTHHSDFHSLDAVAVAPTPHRPGGPPIWVAGSSPDAQRRVGSRYDGWMPIGPVDGFADGLTHVRGAAVDAGRDPDAIATSTYLTISLDDDPAAAERALDEYLAAYYPAPPAAMRAVQATYAGTPDGLVEWVREFVDAGARHLILRFAGNHDRHMEQCIDLLAPLRAP